MNSRDRDYIEGRLLAPAIPLSEAIERLFSSGEGVIAAELSEAATILTDACRDARYKLWYPERILERR
jgi:hypothetical protein